MAPGAGRAAPEAPAQEAPPPSGAASDDECASSTRRMSFGVSRCWIQLMQDPAHLPPRCWIQLMQVRKTPGVTRNEQIRFVP